MRKIIYLILSLLVVFALASCGENAENGNENGADVSDGGDEDMTTEFIMKATVTAIGDKIEVDVYEAEYADGLYWINTDQKTGVSDFSGNKISLSDIKTGDKIEIIYNGQVMMSYPPQVYAIRIKKL